MYTADKKLIEGSSSSSVTDWAEKGTSGGGKQLPQGFHQPITKRKIIKSRARCGEKETPPE